MLELKQQQAGVLQAWLSVNQSDEAIKQSRSVMIFTIVTIVFVSQPVETCVSCGTLLTLIQLPLSFMSSIFGMNSIEIGGDGNTMHLREQFNYMCTLFLKIKELYLPAKTCILTSCAHPVGLSAIVIVLTLAFSLSEWLRALMWSVYATVTLRFATMTGLYRWKLEKNVSSHRLYEWAEKVTRKWKDQQKDLVQEARKKRVMEKESATEGNGSNQSAPKDSMNGNIQADGANAAARQQGKRTKAADDVSPV